MGSRRPERSPRRWRTWFRRLIIAAIAAITLGVAAGLAVFGYFWTTMDLPPEEPMVQTSFLTDADGNRLATLASTENRTSVGLDQIPDVLQQAVMDTEDQDFYQHSGVDPRGVARALYQDLRGSGGLQGGSTLTQQYVKNVYVGSDRTVTRKVKEAILAMKLEQELSKDEILERYLNAIYLGRGTYGVQAASQAYFGKDVNTIGLQESAYLAGIIRGPEITDAYNNADEANLQRSLVLGNMVRSGDITQEEADAVTATDLQSYVQQRQAAQPATVNADKGTQFFVDYVRNQLVQRYGEQMVSSGGLTVKTTLDLDMQTQAYDSIFNTLNREGDPAGALVTVDSNGYIKAMVGGKDYNTSQVNLAIGAAGGGSGRQPGSTFKPIELAAALEAGASVNDRYPGPEQLLVKGYDNTKPVSNFDGEGFGNIDLTEATVHSVNTVYAQMVVDYGVEGLVDMAKKMGVTSELKPNPSLVLGAGEVSPLEMADAYMTFGNRGAHVDPTAILEVKDSEGGILEQSNPQKDQVMSQRTADTVNDVLQQVVSRGTGKAASLGGTEVAGKTGTTDENGDAWFVGYTPGLSTAIWMGYPEGSAKKMTNVHGITVTGGSFPARIFGTYMKQATAGQEDTEFARPATTTTTTEYRAPTTTTEAPEGLENFGDEERPTTGNGGADERLRDFFDDRSSRSAAGNNTTTTTSAPPPVVGQGPGSGRNTGQTTAPRVDDLVGADSP